MNSKDRLSQVWEQNYEVVINKGIFFVNCSPKANCSFSKTTENYTFRSLQNFNQHAQRTKIRPEWISQSNWSLAHPLVAEHFAPCLQEISRHLPHSFSAAVTASSINGLLKQVGIETGGCTSTTRDPGTPTASSVCTMENASRVFPYTSALPNKKKSLIIIIIQ